MGGVDMDNELMDAVKKIAAIEQQLNNQAENIDDISKTQHQMREMMLELLRASAEYREKMLSLQDTVIRAHNRIDKNEETIEAVRNHSQETKDTTSKWLNRGFGFYICVCLFFGLLQWWGADQLKKSEEFKRDARNELISIDRRIQKVELIISVNGGRIPPVEMQEQAQHPNPAKYPAPAPDYQ